MLKSGCWWLTLAWATCLLFAYVLAHARASSSPVLPLPIVCMLQLLPLQTRLTAFCLSALLANTKPVAASRQSSCSSLTGWPAAATALWSLGPPTDLKSWTMPSGKLLSARCNSPQGLAVWDLVLTPGASAKGNWHQARGMLAAAGSLSSVQSTAESKAALLNSFES